MTTKQKLESRRDKIMAIDPTSGQDCLAVGVFHAFETLSPTWLKAYEVVKQAASSHEEFCVKTEWLEDTKVECECIKEPAQQALAEMNKFLDGKK